MRLLERLRAEAAAREAAGLTRVPLLSVPVAGPVEAVATAAGFASAGVRVGCFRPPSVPDGVSRIRLTASAAVAGADLDRATGVVRGLLRG